MNKKGFTLTELLAVIVLMALIIGIAAPNIAKHVSKEDTERKNILQQKIENASKLYAAKYYIDELINCNSNDCNIEFTLDDLEKDGLIDLEEECDLTKIITIYYDEKVKYNYSDVEECYQ